MRRTVKRPILIALLILVVIAAAVAATLLDTQPVRIHPFRDARPVAVIGRK